MFLQFQGPVNTLLNNGTITSIFLVVLLIALSIFAAWTRKLIDTQLTIKDVRIDSLEKNVATLQKSYNDELLFMVRENQKLMQRCNDTFNRMEKLWEDIEKRILNI